MKTYKILVKEDNELKEIERESNHLIFYDKDGKLVYTFDNKSNSEIIINCE